MCGIAGYVGRTERHSSDPDRLKRMLHQVRKRGPDGEGQWIERGVEWTVALGHRRLSIIDVKGGKQPLGDNAGHAQITFNGEIYNFAELRSELEKKGRTFRTQSDTEALLHAMLEYGATRALPMLNGMFAFALWEEATQTLTLARDRVGIKPLYYSHTPDGSLVFASELTALMEHGSLGRKIDSTGLSSYFFLDYAHPPHTLLEGVKKLEPGSFLTWKNGILSEPQRYWSLQSVEPLAQTRARSDEAHAEELWQRLAKAVKRQLVSDVPIGVLLSGGVDSSTIAALAAQAVGEPLRTFSIGFEDPQFDESRYARQMASHIGARHIEHTFTEKSLLDAMSGILADLDEPMADPSLLPTSLLAQVASEHVKVVLGGDGGDELWAGYPTYKAERVAAHYRRLPAFLRKHAVPAVVSRLKTRDGYQTLEWKAKRFALRWDDEPLLGHLRWMSNIDLPELELALGRFSPPNAFLPECVRLPNVRPVEDALNAKLALDFTTYLPGSVLAKVDRASMAHGLEVRPPFLDAEFVDWSFSLPSQFKLRNGTSKYLLKRAAARAVPADILHRRKKGFGIPLAKWLRGPLRTTLDKVFAESPLWDNEILNHQTFLQWRRNHDELREDRSKPLWALIVLDAWAKRHGCV